MLHKIRLEIIDIRNKTNCKNIISKYKLCPKFSKTNIGIQNCFQDQANECDGACIGKIQPKEYNARVQEFINNNSFENQNMIIVDKGRTVSERSAILIENGVYQGYAFYDLNYQIHNIQILKNIIVPMQSNRDTNNIIQSHIRKTKNIKIIKF